MYLKTILYQYFVMRGEGTAGRSIEPSPLDSSLTLHSSVSPTAAWVTCRALSCMGGRGPRALVAWEKERLGKGKVKLGAYPVAARGRGAHLRCTGP